MGASTPFRSFGSALRHLREKHSKSQLEVSGAVEIAPELLAEYEDGKQRPSEDILMLIIQHFDLNDQEAEKLWRLAGYATPFTAQAEAFFPQNDEDQPRTKTVLISASDARIVYTDMVQVMVNDFGVVMNFMQGAGINNQPLAVSRIGMSKEHAQSVLELLAKTLAEATSQKWS